MTVIWHNPRCSKSRQTLAILAAKEVRSVLAKLGKTATQIVRRGEKGFKDGDDAHLIALMAANPVLIERPIVIVGNDAVIGRPPENALDLFD